MNNSSSDSPTRLVGSDRVLAVLRELGEHPQGLTLDAIASSLDSPKPTIHRALGSLRRAGFATQVSRGRYILGDEFLRLALHTIAERPDSAIVGPVLDRLAEQFGETTHYAILEGTDVVYRAKADPPSGAVRLTSVIGGRNPAYCTAVGKLLLSNVVANRADLVELLGPGPLPRRTEHTITDIAALWGALEEARERGFAVDDQENEAGVNCVAVAMPTDSRLLLPGAVSVSALAFRTPLAQLVEQVPSIVEAVIGR
ncbi:DNA-binding IclR family transcriptional regulator [Microbacterium terrae]|uniref:Pca regulon regulatory protein n=1 Tax=Microbacterium terrae TaxID=69369 RepID=A0A0M2H1S9_9MICO|nr:IclR family transcriptional regulator [Microbacterium terrae]KJL37523.1 Pca regulon regulatory protein [Microbacterium terrae]MBP1076352.1 DNA-binding IclR family transcriptional regulator [Microbacterium terrae]GLJ97176.1 IclR family transcriptional regulator [Microbacterium terrae]